MPPVWQFGSRERIRTRDHQNKKTSLWWPIRDRLFHLQLKKWSVSIWFSFRCMRWNKPVFHQIPKPQNLSKVIICSRMRIRRKCDWVVEWRQRRGSRGTWKCPAFTVSFWSPKGSWPIIINATEKFERTNFEQLILKTMISWIGI